MLWDLDLGNKKPHFRTVYYSFARVEDPHCPLHNKDRNNIENHKMKEEKMTGTAVNNSLRIGTASMGVFIGEISTLLWDMRWLMLLAGVLIIVDLWLGVHKSFANNVDIRASRALRRTMMKIADYLCVVILGAVVGKALGEPLGCSAIVIAVVLMSIACLCELDSIISNWGEIKGVKINVFKIILGLVGYKRKELGEALKGTITITKKRKK